MISTLLLLGCAAPADAAAICIGPVCIPYTAFIPFFYYLWVPLLKWLRKTFPNQFPTPEKPKAGAFNGKEADDSSADSAALPAAKRDKRSKDGGKEAGGSPLVVPSSGGGMVVLEDDEDWAGVEARAQAAGQAIVLCFTATWCGPCQAIAPAFKRLALEHPGAVFVKVRRGAY
jgi:thiol-disulfide isomerase/thioredoxin